MSAELGGSQPPRPCTLCLCTDYMADPGQVCVCEHSEVQHLQGPGCEIMLRPCPGNRASTFRAENDIVRAPTVSEAGALVCVNCDQRYYLHHRHSSRAPAQTTAAIVPAPPVPLPPVPSTAPARPAVGRPVQDLFADDDDDEDEDGFELFAPAPVPASTQPHPTSARRRVPATAAAPFSTQPHQREQRVAQPFPMRLSASPPPLPTVASLFDANPAGATNRLSRMTPLDSAAANRDRQSAAAYHRQPRVTQAPMPLPSQQHASGISGNPFPRSMTSMTGPSFTAGRRAPQQPSTASATPSLPRWPTTAHGTVTGPVRSQHQARPEPYPAPASSSSSGQGTRSQGRQTNAIASSSRASSSSSSSTSSSLPLRQKGDLDIDMVIMISAEPTPGYTSPDGLPVPAKLFRLTSGNGATPKAQLTYNRAKEAGLSFRFTRTGARPEALAGRAITAGFLECLVNNGYSIAGGHRPSYPGELACILLRHKAKDKREVFAPLHALDQAMNTLTYQGLLTVAKRFPYVRIEGGENVRLMVVAPIRRPVIGPIDGLGTHYCLAKRLWHGLQTINPEEEEGVDPECETWCTIDNPSNGGGDDDDDDDMDVDNDTTPDAIPLPQPLIIASPAVSYHRYRDTLNTVMMSEISLTVDPLKVVVPNDEAGKDLLRRVLGSIYRDEPLGVLPAGWSVRNSNVQALSVATFDAVVGQGVGPGPTRSLLTALRNSFSDSALWRASSTDGYIGLNNCDPAFMSQGNLEQLEVDGFILRQLLLWGSPVLPVGPSTLAVLLGRPDLLSHGVFMQRVAPGAHARAATWPPTDLPDGTSTLSRMGQDPAILVMESNVVDFIPGNIPQNIPPNAYPDLTPLLERYLYSGVPATHPQGMLSIADADHPACLALRRGFFAKGRDLVDMKTFLEIVGVDVPNLIVMLCEGRKIRKPSDVVRLLSFDIPTPATFAQSMVDLRRYLEGQSTRQRPRPRPVNPAPAATNSTDAANIGDTPNLDDTATDPNEAMSNLEGASGASAGSSSTTDQAPPPPPSAHTFPYAEFEAGAERWKKLFKQYLRGEGHPSTNNVQNLEAFSSMDPATLRAQIFLKVATAEDTLPFDDRGIKIKFISSPLGQDRKIASTGVCFHTCSRTMDVLISREIAQTLLSMNKPTIDVEVRTTFFTAMHGLLCEAGDFNVL